jgi:DNA-binding MarR family transcriptional regulator
MCVRTHVQGGYRGHMVRTAWQDDDLLGAWSALLRLHAALVPAIDAELTSATGIPLGWYDVMLELYQAPQRRMRMTELGQAVVLSRSRVSRVVDELERNGYLVRIPNPDDRRSSYAELTTDGRTAFKKAAPIYLAAIRSQFGAALPTRDATALRRLLEDALQRLDHSVAATSRA